jgi:hypothetical protein
VVKRSVTIKTRTFHRAGDATIFFREMLHRYPFGQPIPAPDASDLFALLERHEEKEEKIGPGILRFEVGAPPDGYSGRCFWIVRTDGTRIDFSFPHCLKAKPTD